MKPPTIPEAAIEAAAVELHERTVLSADLAQYLAGHAVRAALPALLPGLYVTRAEGMMPMIWRVEVDDRPTPLLGRDDGDEAFFDALAALLPDRTDDIPEG